MSGSQDRVDEILPPGPDRSVVDPYNLRQGRLDSCEQDAARDLVKLGP